MSRIVAPTAAAGAKPVVIALHCSGASGEQWRGLARHLGDRFTVIAPDLIGNSARGHWSGEHAFKLSDEAAAIVTTIDDLDEPVHLVGHSYGGGVALRIAVERPHRIASLSLYEPTAFHVLKAMGPDGRTALEEIAVLAADVDRAVLSGAYRAAAERFVNYWSGADTFAALKPETQSALARYMPKACLDFRALMDERMPLVAYARLGVPVLLMRGERGPEPTAAIARKLFDVMQPRQVRALPDAGHMGPFTHADAVSRAVAEHIERCVAMEQGVADQGHVLSMAA